MEQLQLTDFLTYRSLSGLALSPDGKKAAFIVKQPDVERDDYVSDIYLCSLDTGDVIALTAGRRVIAFDWQTDSLHLLCIERGQSAEEGSCTHAFELETGSGAAPKAFTLPGRPACIKVLDARRVLYLMPVDLSATQDRWPEADCEVADELPIWRDGEGHTNKRRVHLFLFDRAEQCSEELTRGSLHVEAFDVRGERVVLSGSDYDQVAPLRNDLYLLDLASRDIRRLTHQTHCFLGNSFCNTAALEHNCSWFYYCYPIFRSTFSFTHSCFSRFLGKWLIGEYSYPYFSVSLHLPCQSYPGCFNLPLCYPCSLH